MGRRIDASCQAADHHDTAFGELGRDRPQKWQNYLDRLKELSIPYPTVLPKKPAPFR